MVLKKTRHACIECWNDTPCIAVGPMKNAFGGRVSPTDDTASPFFLVLVTLTLFVTLAAINLKFQEAAFMVVSLSVSLNE